MVLLAGFVAGSSSGTVDVQTYSGQYFYNFETASFTLDGASEAWCVAAAKLAAAELPSDGNPNGRWGTAHVVVRGVLSKEGHYCNLGAYRYFLDVKEVVEIRDQKRRRPQDAP